MRQRPFVLYSGKALVLMRASVAVIKCRDQKQFGEGKGLFASLVRPLREAKAGSWRELKQRPCANSANCLAPHGLLSLLP